MRKFILKSVLLMSFLGCNVSIYAEETLNATPRSFSILPPSPNASSLMKYTEFPVSYFTGIPDISFNLYTVSEGDLSVPVSISYHGGGVRVDDKDSCLGLGWTLLSGGAISRSIYGLPDETQQRGCTGLFKISSKNKQFREYIIGKRDGYDPSNANVQESNIETIINLCYDYESGKIDVANDIFQFNCAGKTGTFIYDIGNTNKLVVSSSSAVEIEPSSAMMAYPLEFVIADENGTRYYFDVEEKSRHEFSFGPIHLPQQTDSLYYTSTWYLSKIKSIRGDSIMFYYKDFGQKRVNVNGPGTLQTAGEYWLDKKYGFGSKYSGGTVVYYPKLLNSIVSSSAIVQFSYDGDYVESIKVLTNDDNRKVVKNYEFEYLVPLQQSEHRLLESIEEIINGSRQILYQFDYYLQDGFLPLYWKDADYGGYYNGAGNVNTYPELDNIYVMGATADRSVSPENCVYGSLKSVYYPTGGKTTFYWEPNEYGYIKDNGVKGNVMEVTTEKDTELCGLIGYEKLKVTNFGVGVDAEVTMDLSTYFNHLDEFIIDWADYNSSHKDLMNVTTPIDYPHVVFIRNDVTGDKEVARFFIDRETVGDGSPVFVPLEHGIYTVELRSPLGSFEEAPSDPGLMNRFEEGPADYGKVVIHNRVVKYDLSRMKKRYWPGLRIKYISSVANDNDSIVKQYLYSTLDPYMSSGIISREPQFLSSYDFIGQKTLSATAIGLFYADLISLSTEGLYSTPMGRQGVEYDAVSERYLKKIGDVLDTDVGGSNTITYVYSSQKTPEYNDFNDTDFLSSQPVWQQMWTSKAHLRGNLLEKRYDMSVGGGSQQYASVVYKYDYNIYEDPEKHEFTTNMFKVADFTYSGMLGGGIDYSIGRYQLIPYNKTLKSETVIEGDLSGYEENYDLDNIYHTKTEYTYFNDRYTSSKDYKLVRSKKFTDSDGTVTETFYTYEDADGEYLPLIECEVSVVDGKVVGGKRMEYYPGTHLLKAVYAPSPMSRGYVVNSILNLGNKNGGNRMLRALFNQKEYEYEYDTNGNVVQIKYNGEVLASYLWGYKGSYPVMEVRNLPYGELVEGLAALGYSPENLWWITDSDRIKSIMEGLRSRFDGYEVTTMAYHWLIGVVSATDSRGITTNFTYDDFGRLSDVRDFNGYFIRKYDYHYAE